MEKTRRWEREVRSSGVESTLLGFIPVSLFVDGDAPRRRESLVFRRDLRPR
jgi:hypothetical protein